MPPPLRARPVHVVLNRRGIRGVALPASALAARTRRTVFVDCDVAELARHRLTAMQQLAVDEEANADPFRHRDRNHMTDAFGMAAEPELPERAGIRRVLEHDRQPARGLDQWREIDVAPAQVRCEDETPVVVNSSRQADAHPLANDARMRAPHRGNRASQPAYERLGGLRRRPRCLLDVAGIDAGQSDSRDLRAQLHRDDAGALDIETEERRLAVVCRIVGGALADPALLDQLVDDGRDRRCAAARTRARAQRVISKCGGGCN